MNPRSKHASLSLTASLAALRAGYKREAQVIKKYVKKWQKKYFFGILYLYVEVEMMCDELKMTFMQIAQRGV